MKSTPLLLLTGLAEGADQLVADAALDCGAYLAAVLPLPKAIYRSQMEEPARAEFDRLLARSSLVIDLPLKSSHEELADSEEARARQYSDLADFIGLHCQALIALWDGEDSSRPGGTFEVVRSVLAGVEYENCIEPLRGTVYHIVTPRQQSRTRADAFHTQVMRCPSDLDEISRAVPVAFHTKLRIKLEKQADLDKFCLTAADLKGWRLEPRRRFWRWVAKATANRTGAIARWRLNLWRSLVEPSENEARLAAYNKQAARLTEERFSKWRLQPKDWRADPWPYLKRIDACHRRADVIAIGSQRRRNVFFAGILLWALLAALGLETHSSLKPDVDLFWLAFPVAIIAAATVYLIAGWRNIENRFLDARVLAEAVRVQYFWELGGVRKPVWKYYLAHRPSELGWVVSALRGLALLCHEQPAPPPTEADVRGALAGWVEDQAKWYGKTSQRQRTSLEAMDLASNIVLLVVVMVLLGCGAIMLAPWEQVAAWRRSIGAAHAWIHWGVAIASVGVGLTKVWLEHAGYDEQARSYRRMGHLFAHRQKRLEALLPDQKSKSASGSRCSTEASGPAGMSDPERMQHAVDVLCDLGIKALEENSIWLVMHREHPIKVTGGG